MKVSIISIFRDEAKYLKEWIEFHLLIGVDHFYLVNNNSIDNFLEILNPYISKKIVTLYNIDIEIINNSPTKKNEQILVHEWIQKLNSIVSESNDDWIIHVSTDEFIYPTTKFSIKEILETYEENVGEISVNWTLFGHNNFMLETDDLLIEKLTKSSHYDHIHNYHVKPIFKPKAIKYIPSVHFTNLKPGYIKVDATGNPNNFKTNYEVKERILNPIHINHYRLRDLGWTNKKLKIYEIWGRSEFKDLKNEYNDIDNFIILRFLPKLKNMLAQNIYVYNNEKENKDTKKINPTKESLNKTNYIITNMIGDSFHNHYHILYDIANHMNKNNLIYMEIGTYAGSSASLMAMNENVSKIFSVDIGQLIEQSIPIQNVNKFKHQNCSYEYIKGNSRIIDTINLVKEKINNIDILFIDGDHSYQAVIDDFENYKSLVNIGGYIIFDDYMDERYSPEVCIAVNEIISKLNPNEYEIIGSIKYDLIIETNQPTLKSSNEFILKKIK